MALETSPSQAHDPNTTANNRALVGPIVVSDLGNNQQHLGPVFLQMGPVLLLLLSLLLAAAGCCRLSDQPQPDRRKQR
jgi:hypothetical protein